MSLERLTQITEVGITSGITLRNINVEGAYISGVFNVSGISTFTNGPVLVGSGTSTGTASQPLQVTGGAYVSDSVGIGTTNPTQKLHVVGNASISGTLDLGHATDTTLARSAAGVVSIEGANIVTTSSTDTLTNKTLTSPTLTTPALGTPTTGNLTNCTGLNASNLDSGTVPVLRLGASGTRSVSTFLSGNNTWETVSSGATLNNSPSGTYYPTMSASTSGSFLTAYVSSSAFTFTTSTGTLSATQFSSTSDVTKKKNIRPIENAIDITKKLQGVRFDWKDTGASSIGMIAQEVEKVLPELVVENDGVKSVSYGNLVGVLIEAIKEQEVRIQELERKLNA
jgi:hypothetical protein